MTHKVKKTAHGKFFLKINKLTVPNQLAKASFFQKIIKTHSAFIRRVNVQHRILIQPENSLYKQVKKYVLQKLFSNMTSFFVEACEPQLISWKTATVQLHCVCNSQNHLLDTTPFTPTNYPRSIQDVTGGVSKAAVALECYCCY